MKNECLRLKKIDQAELNSECNKDKHITELVESLLSIQDSRILFDSLSHISNLFTNIYSMCERDSTFILGTFLKLLISPISNSDDIQNILLTILFHILIHSKYLQSNIINYSDLHLILLRLVHPSPSCFCSSFQLLSLLCKNCHLSHLVYPMLKYEEIHKFIDTPFVIEIMEVYYHCLKDSYKQRDPLISVIDILLILSKQIFKNEMYDGYYICFKFFTLIAHDHLEQVQEFYPFVKKTLKLPKTNQNIEAALKLCNELFKCRFDLHKLSFPHLLLLTQNENKQVQLSALKLIYNIVSYCEEDSFNSIDIYDALEDSDLYNKLFSILINGSLKAKEISLQCLAILSRSHIDVMIPFIFCQSFFDFLEIIIVDYENTSNENLLNALIILSELIDFPLSSDQIIILKQFLSNNEIYEILNILIDNSENVISILSKQLITNILS